MKKLLKGIGLLCVSFASGTNLYAETVQAPTTTDGTTTTQTTNTSTESALKAASVTGSVTVKVVDKDGYGIGGAQFTAFNSDNVATAVMTTDENGETTSKPIPAGKYTIRQTGEPNGYYENKTYYYATISSQGQVVDINGGANVINYPVPTNKSGNITGKVVDDQGYGVAGVKFTIYNTRNIPVAYVTTDENGKFVSKSLESGKYTIRQTGQPSKYYDNKQYYYAEISSDGQQAAINGGSSIVNHKISNPNEVKGIISATVVDENSQPVSGVTFTAYDSRNISAGTMTTDGNGKAQLDNLPADNYTIRQTGQPSMYYDNKQYYYATIDQAGEHIDINNTLAITVYAIPNANDNAQQASDNASSDATTTSNSATTSGETSDKAATKEAKSAKSAKTSKSTASSDTKDTASADSKQSDTKAKEEEQSVVENIIQSISDFIANIIDSIKNIFN